MNLINNFSTRLTEPLSASDDYLPVSDTDMLTLLQLKCPLTLSSNQGLESVIEIIQIDDYGKITRGMQGTTALNWPKGSVLYVSVTAKDANKVLNPAYRPSGYTGIKVDYGSKAGIYTAEYYEREEVLICLPSSSWIDDPDLGSVRQLYLAVSVNGGDFFNFVPLQFGGSVLAITTEGYRYLANGYYSVFALAKDDDGDTVRLFEIVNNNIVSTSTFSIANDFAGEDPEFVTFKDRQAIYTASNFYSITRADKVFSVESAEALNFSFTKMTDGYLDGSYYGSYAITEEGEFVMVYGAGATAYSGIGALVVDAVRLDGSNFCVFAADGKVYKEDVGDVFKTIAIDAYEEITSVSYADLGDGVLAYAVGTSAERIMLLDTELNLISELSVTSIPHRMVFTGSGLMWQDQNGRVASSGLNSYRDGYMPGWLLDDIMKRLAALELQVTP